MESIGLDATKILTATVTATRTRDHEPRETSVTMRDE
jgi:hypothetical protein